MERISLYRHFNADGDLLYVGISASHMSRLSQHKDKSHWYWDISRVEIEHFECRSEARYREAIAIRDEKPMHNVAKPIPVHPDDIIEAEGVSEPVTRCECVDVRGGRERAIIFAETEESVNDALNAGRWEGLIFWSYEDKGKAMTEAKRMSAFANTPLVCV